MEFDYLIIFFFFLSNRVQVDLLLASSQPPHIANGCGSWLDYYSLQSEINQPITAACLVGDSVWLGDARGQLFCFRFVTFFTSKQAVLRH